MTIASDESKTVMEKEGKTIIKIKRNSCNMGLYEVLSRINALKSEGKKLFKRLNEIKTEIMPIQNEFIAKMEKQHNIKPADTDDVIMEDNEITAYLKSKEPNENENIEIVMIRRNEQNDDLFLLVKQQEEKIKKTANLHRERDEWLHKNIDEARTFSEDLWKKLKLEINRFETGMKIDSFDEEVINIQIGGPRPKQPDFPTLRNLGIEVKDEKCDDPNCKCQD